jgi:hypothetical protein
MVQDMSGRPRAVDFDRATLAKIGAAEVRARCSRPGCAPRMTASWSPCSA